MAHVAVTGSHACMVGVDFACLRNPIQGLNMLASKKSLQQPFGSSLLCRMHLRDGVVVCNYSGGAHVWGEPKFSEMSHLGSMQAAAAMVDVSICTPGPRCIELKNSALAQLSSVVPSHAGECGHVGQHTCAIIPKSQKRKRDKSQTAAGSKQARSKVDAVVGASVQGGGRGMLLQIAAAPAQKSYLDLPSWFRTWIEKFLPHIKTSQSLAGSGFRLCDKRKVSGPRRIKDNTEWVLQVCKQFCS